MKGSDPFIFPAGEGQEGEQEQGEARAVTAAAAAGWRWRWGWRRRRCRDGAFRIGRGCRGAGRGGDERPERTIGAAGVALCAGLVFVAQPMAAPPVHGTRRVSVERHLREVVDVGMTTDDLDRIAEERIRGLNAVPSFKGYRVGRNVYPKTICTSVNDQVVHGIPNTRPLNAGDIVSKSQRLRDYQAICERTEIIMLDSQYRVNARGFQSNGEMGKLIHGLLGWEKLIPESLALYGAGQPSFRLASKPAPEARMWAVEGFAGGIQPWWHHIGAYHEDRRQYRTAGPLFRWHQEHEAALLDRLPAATVGVVWSQENVDYYGRDQAEVRYGLPWRGLTDALIRARIPYLPIHADHVERDAATVDVIGALEAPDPERAQQRRAGGAPRLGHGCLRRETARRWCGRCCGRQVAAARRPGRSRRAGHRPARAARGSRPAARHGGCRWIPSSPSSRSWPASGCRPRSP